MPAVRTVIFDLYNTLIEDPVTAEREQYRLDSTYSALEKSGYPVRFPDLQEKFMQVSVYGGEYESGKRRSFTPFMQVEYFMRLLKNDNIVLFKKIYDIFTDAAIQVPPRPMKNAARALAYLKDKGLLLGLVSNTTKTPGVTLRFLLREMGLYGYLDDLVFSDEAGVPKPHPAIFRLALDRLSARPEETVFVGDMERIDCGGARSAGMQCVLFRPLADDLYRIAVEITGGFEEEHS